MGWSEMASREKRTLASSKLKHKVNNNTSNDAPIALPTTNSSSTKKLTKSAAAAIARSQSVAREILEAVTTGNQLPVKLEAGLPRKRVLQTTLKRKQKTAKKAKPVVTEKQKVKRINSAAKKIPVGRKKKPSSKVSTPTSSVDIGLNTSNESDDSKSEYTTTQTLTLILFCTNKFLARFLFCNIQIFRLFGRQTLSSTVNKLTKSFVFCLFVKTTKPRIYNKWVFLTIINTNFFFKV